MKKKNKINYTERYKKHLKSEICDSEKKIQEALLRDRLIKENPLEFLCNLNINSYLPYKELKDILNNKNYRRHFKQNGLIKVLLAKIIKENVKYLKHRELIVGIFNVAILKQLHLNDVLNWKFKIGNPYTDFYNLLRYLFDRHSEIPEFLFKIWLSPLFTYNYRWWSGTIEAFGAFVHLSKGSNIRTFRYYSRNWDDRHDYETTYKLYLINNAAKYFYDAPSEYTFKKAVRWSQFMHLTKNKQKTDALMKTRLIDAFNEQFYMPFSRYYRDFWKRVILFIANSPQIPIKYYWTVIEYIYFIKFGYYYDDFHPYYNLKGSVPNFDVSGKNPARILEEALKLERWFRKNKALQEIIKKNPENIKFPKMDINDFHKVINGLDKNRIEYRIIRLKSKKELINEAKIMKHCVDSYTSASAIGECSIWSLQRVMNNKVERLITIKLNRDKELVEARGYKNRKPMKDEMELIKEWAERENLESKII